MLFRFVLLNSVSFGHLDFSSGAGVRSLLEATCSATPQASCAKLDHRQVDHMHELHHAVQHQISGKWLLAAWNEQVFHCTRVLECLEHFIGQKMAENCWALLLIGWVHTIQCAVG